MSSAVKRCPKAIISALCWSRSERRVSGLLPAALQPMVRWLAQQSYGVYLVHHVFLTLVVLPLTIRLSLPLMLVLPVYLAASVAGAAVLGRLAAPLSRILKAWGAS